MGVASINPTFAECLETRIKRIILLKFLIGLILWLIVFYQPEIGMLTFVEDGRRDSLFLSEKKWWSRRDSNPRPPRCERGALPTELLPHDIADIRVRPAAHPAAPAPRGRSISHAPHTHASYSSRSGAAIRHCVTASGPGVSTAASTKIRTIA